MPATLVQESLRLWRPEGMAGVEVVHAERSVRLQSAVHDLYTFTLVTRGAVDWRYRGRDFHTAAGGLGIIPPGEPHRLTHIAAALDFKILLVEPPALDEAARELRGDARAPDLRLFVRDPLLAAELARFHAALLDGSTALERQTRLALALKLILTRAVEDEGAAPARVDDPAAVRRAREYLDEHWARDISLDELARAAHASKFHLVRTFRARMGLPPHAYQIELRMGRARDLLSRGFPVSHVAFETGFADQSHFHRHFRRLMGMTPGEYARAAGARRTRASRG